MDADRVHRIAVELAAEGSAHSPVGVDATQWRRDARAAARRLDRDVETLCLPDGQAEARLSDWPRDDAELQIHRAALRRAAVAAWVEPASEAAVPMTTPADVDAVPDGPELTVVDGELADHEILHPSQRTPTPDLHVVSDA